MSILRQSSTGLIRGAAWQAALLLCGSLVIAPAHAGLEADAPEVPAAISVDERIERLMVDAHNHLFGADFRVALALLSDAAMLGHLPALVEIGRLHETGLAGRRDAAEARRWYERAARAGQADALARLAWADISAPGSSGALRQAGLGRLQQIQANSSFALYAIGRLHEQGLLLARDELLAAEYYEKAARGGMADAQLALAMAYLQGRGVSESPRMAALWLDEAARQGLAAAQRHLGRLFRDAWGVDRDGQEAAFWLEKAAVQGDVPAMLDLGLIHLDARAMSPDPQQARQWLEKAARFDPAAAQFQFARLILEQGLTGIEPQDGIRRMRAAAAAGWPEAIDYLEKMKP